MKKFAIVWAAILLSGNFAFAQKNEALTFTRIERNPRSAAMAGAGSASTSNVAYAAFNNAASAAFYNGSGDFSLGYQYWAPKMGASHAINAAGAYNFGRVALSAGAMYNIDKKAEDGYKPSNLQLNLGVGVKIAEWLGLGLNARYAQDNLFQGYALRAFAFDASAFFKPAKGLTLSAGVANLGSMVKDSQSREYAQPSSLRASAAYLLEIGAKNSIEFMLDEDYYLNSKSNGISAGLEYSFNRMIYARAGYRYATDGAAFSSHLGLGLGFQFAGFRLDVSYLTLSDVFNGTIAAGIGYRF